MSKNEENSVFKKLDILLLKCDNEKVNPLDYPSIQRFLHEKWIIPVKYILCLILISTVILFMLVREYIFQEKCLIDMHPNLKKAFRPPISCDFCRNVHKVVHEEGISPEEFERKYAYSAVPVIIVDGTRNWTAQEKFDFWYFKNLYTQVNRKGEILNCQFFPYKSGFNNLLEAFKILGEKSNSEINTGSWYFGWSNCNGEIAEILREHYSRPYFLPKSSENNAVDWIFMGGSGLGAHMHVDNVRLPSWQAQLKGSKQWILAPPPECYFQCAMFKTTVKPGEIISLDTNKWYHQTIVTPGQISVTIGAEYD